LIYYTNVVIILIVFYPKNKLNDAELLVYNSGVLEVVVVYRSIGDFNSI